MEPNECIYTSLDGIADGNAKMPGWFMDELKQFVKSHVNEHLHLLLLKLYHRVINLFTGQKSKRPKHDNKAISVFTTQPLKAGEIVRVRSLAEIEATLDDDRKCKGCGFMDAQESYCGTVQKVLKPVERFVHERDFQVKKSKNLYILEGVMCQGTKTFGRCDRSCFLFWRGEWLEKLDKVNSFIFLGLINFHDLLLHHLMMASSHY